MVEPTFRNYKGLSHSKQVHQAFIHIETPTAGPTSPGRHLSALLKLRNTPPKSFGGVPCASGKARFLPSFSRCESLSAHIANALLATLSAA